MTSKFGSEPLLWMVFTFRAFCRDVADPPGEDEADDLRRGACLRLSPSLTPRRYLILISSIFSGDAIPPVEPLREGIVCLCLGLSFVEIVVIKSMLGAFIVLPIPHAVLPISPAQKPQVAITTIKKYA